uniref:Ig-like domain-containing protein n=1 Tax=Astatotilapia calliptera TaxID=8154 RepID=A0A3P8QCH3_ASTCA
MSKQINKIFKVNHSDHNCTLTFNLSALCCRFPLSDKTITAESGEDVTLTCRAPNKKIIVIVWSREDLKDEYVLFYQKAQFVPEYQHPSFKNRVDLQDRQMKDGDVSLILKDVNTADSGTYECRLVSGTKRRRRDISTEPISIIYLHVRHPAINVQVGFQLTKLCGEKNERRRESEREEKKGRRVAHLATYG